MGHHVAQARGQVTARPRRLDRQAGRVQRADVGDVNAKDLGYSLCLRTAAPGRPLCSTSTVCSAAGDLMRALF